MYSESHGHLRNLADDVIEQALARAAAQGVNTVLTAGIDLASSRQAIDLARRFTAIHACIGIHPWNADQYSDSALTELTAFAHDPHVVAISEIGLDYVGRMNRAWTFVPDYIDKDIQRTAFTAQLRLAKAVGLPVLVHDRTPDDEVLETLEREANVTTGVAIHGFTKDREYAQRCIRQGMYLSMGVRDVCTPEHTPLWDVIQSTPLTRLLIETDSPNPVDVISVAEKIAELKGLTPEDVGAATTQNLRTLIPKL